jgi:tetratricopeptide (TPR) repeat protein
MDRGSAILACWVAVGALCLGRETAAQEPPASGGGSAGGAPHVDPAAPTGDEVDTLFYRAQQAFDEGRFEDALMQLARAWERRQSYDIAGNLGIVELKLGRVLDAAEHLDFALHNFPQNEDASLRIGLQSKLEEARSQVGTIVLRVEPPDAEVVVNGRRVGPGIQEGKVFVGAGVVTILARSKGFLEEQRTLTMEKGEQIEVVIELRKIPARTLRLPSRLPSTRPPSPLWPIVVGSGVGIVGIGVGIGFTVAGGGKESDAEALHDAILDKRKSCVTGAENYDAVRCPTLDETARHADTLHDAGIGLLIGGGLALVGSGGYLLWREREKSRRVPGAALQLAPWGGVAGVGLSAAGSF